MAVSDFYPATATEISSSLHELQNRFFLARCAFFLEVDSKYVLRPC